MQIPEILIQFVYCGTQEPAISMSTLSDSGRCFPGGPQIVCWKKYLSYGKRMPTMLQDLASAGLKHAEDWASYW